MTAEHSRRIAIRKPRARRQKRSRSNWLVRQNSVLAQSGGEDADDPKLMIPIRDERLSEDLQVTNAESRVLEIFRSYGVLPYQMLCLNWKLQQDLHVPLDRLIQKGFIVREGRHDAYHLTPIGYQAVKKVPDSE
jgi:hypothetical protein